MLSAICANCSWLSSSETAGQARYSYKFCIVPKEKKQGEELREAMDERQIQFLVDSILGVDSKRYSSKPANEGKEPNDNQSLASKLLIP